MTDTITIQKQEKDKKPTDIIKSEAPSDMQKTVYQGEAIEARLVTKGYRKYTV